MGFLFIPIWVWGSARAPSARRGFAMKCGFQFQSLHAPQKRKRKHSKGSNGQLCIGICSFLSIFIFVFYFLVCYYRGDEWSQLRAALERIQVFQTFPIFGEENKLANISISNFCWRSHQTNIFEPKHRGLTCTSQDLPTTKRLAR